MPEERTFFDMRYLFPGFSFILGLVLYSQLIIFRIELPDFTVGILAFIGIQPIGFFFSQFWHVIMNVIRLNMCQSQNDRFRPSSYYFIKYFNSNNLNNNKFDFKKLNNKKLLEIRDYFYHYYLSLNREKSAELNHIRSYLSRRWDLINTIGNGVLCYIFGIIIGYGLFNTIKKNEIIIQTLNATVILYYNNTNVTKTEINKIIINQFPKILLEYYYVFLNIFSVLFIIVSLYGINWINSERQSLLINIFNELEIKKEDIIKVFPELE